MFVPITMVERVKNLDEAMQLANDTIYGLTAGFYGDPSEIDWFYDHIQAGVVYANRPQGSTTGAWPGFQPFGGWKGSGASGKIPADFTTCRSICTNKSAIRYGVPNLLLQWKDF